jgi:hypothetical protein
MQKNTNKNYITENLQKARTELTEKKISTSLIILNGSIFIISGSIFIYSIMKSNKNL